MQWTGDYFGDWFKSIIPDPKQSIKSEDRAIGPQKRYLDFQTVNSIG